MHTDPVTYLESAREAIAAERDRSACEAEAFRAFADRIEALDTAPAGGDRSLPIAPDARAIRNDSSVATTAEIWPAYRETVTAVPHFETDYAETPREHLRTELGEDVAALIADPRELTQYHERVIASRVESSIDLREEQLEKMDGEAAMVDQAADLVTEATATLERRDAETILEMSREEIEDAVTHLDGSIAQCDQLLSDRQQQLDSRPEVKRWDRESTVGYLYRDCDVNYPVIAAVTTVREQLQSQKRDLQVVKAN